VNRKIRIGVAAVLLAGVATGAITLGRHSAPAEAALEAPRQSVLTVTVVTPHPVQWPQTLPASGAVAAWQEAVIGSEVGSLQITDLFVDVGSVVTRGQELARLSRDSTFADLHKQQAAVAQAKASLSQAQADAKRARAVKDSGALSDQQINNYLITEETARASLASAEAALESTRITLAKTSVRAVDDGVVTSRSATLGAVVSAGSELFRLLRQSRVEWNAEMDAQQIALVRSGQKAHLTLADGRQVEGVVRMVAPTLNSNTSRAIAYVALPTDSGAKAGSFATGAIDLETKVALTLPQSAVVLRDGRSFVFTVGDDSRAIRHLVTTGQRRDNRVEIVKGLNAGVRVVESGGAFLADGAQVTVVATEPKS